MRNERNLSYGVGLLVLAVFALLGWARLTPASAQDNTTRPQSPSGGQRMYGGPASVAANGDFVYVVRGGTLYQMRVADLSLVKQQDLPVPGAAAGATGTPSNGQ